MVAKHPVDAVTCDGIAKSVEEDGGIGGAVVDEGNQRVCSGWPEWAATYFAALSSVLYIADSIMLGELFGEANPHLPQCPDDISV
jgi:hypothetical protein